ncbi:MAG TPA: GFA family protein [Gammaproteobacteria bacterium]
MKLEASCHCGAVRFSVESPAPQPYMRCYCSICRKTAGGGGYAINLMGDAQTLRVEGEENISVYCAVLEDGSRSTAERRFCKHCGSFLWAFDPRWSELVHPFASAVDTPLPVPPEHAHIMLDSKAGWVEVPRNARDRYFDAYPDRSIVEWHRERGLLEGE